MAVRTGRARPADGVERANLSRAAWDAFDLLRALRYATATLSAEVDDVNALNVFPVPDGDTGSNMLATMLAAVEAAEQVPGRDRTVPAIAHAFSRGALMGARGNSGVILSQLLRGVADALDGRPAVDGPALAAALEGGHRAATAAVAHPVEGTMLTVARAAAEAARAAVRNTNPGNTDLDPVLAATVEAAQRAVEATPQQLRVLAEAGVVDAGGRGLELCLRGALAYLRDEPLPITPHERTAFPSFAVDEDEGFGYETVFMLTPSDGQLLDPVTIRGQLDAMGESVLVGGDVRAVKIHIHNERPDRVIAYGLGLGTLTNITVENLDRQAHDLRWAGRHESAASETAAPGWPTAPAAAPSGGVAVVAVASGSGLARIFSELGASGVVTGGQSANPSAGDLVDGIRATGQSTVIVLPNNPNVRLAAKQAGQLLPDVNVSVVPTRNAAEGVAAMLAHDPDRDAEHDVAAMTTAALGVQTMQVTAAVRDARIGRRKVRRGEHIVLGPDDGLLAADRDRQAAVKTAFGRLDGGFELVTIYFGEGADREAAEALAGSLAADLPDVEFEIVEGGQPHYSFLIAVE